ncbi:MULTISPECIES: nicotinate phosphoribosyltransferase [Halomonas]|uniref:Nicotinate phosphoribosyltransferase n=1 Tax=Halomonas halophila TaxID=29573 RepID=A0ABQ0U0N9_9GAMM|nr:MULTISPECIES: nicotinate phosphoribosyltransferase [Halomonas]MDR5888786.1 nicotinate phosphoribosyltransferase [Halomonas salina]WJY07966.1 nicotinate phosphoribosyltransferase [Halomonas halophila]GEK72106.1 nicotinate phosphoribosyltransferase [Halomonas halophila]
MDHIAPLSVDDDELALLTDLYQLTMTQAYWKEAMTAPATFSLFFRRLPPERRFMLACGQQHAAERVSRLRFTDRALRRLAEVDHLEPAFLDWLADWRFEGDIWALPEGTPVFANEPLLEVDAPIAQAQLLESLIMNLVQLETVLASKAVRMVMAARGRPVVDFGLRRMHGVDAAVRGVRAYRAAGLSGTSNVLGGLRHGLALNGTMAHSYVLAHDSEREAFRAFARHYPGTTLLVDTHDTLEGVKTVIALMREEAGLEIGAIRLDSGDLGELARGARALLDAAGHVDVKIVASSGLDEHAIEALLADGAPIDAFGVGTRMGVAADAPVIDLSYKLVEYAGEPTIKHSPGKINLPGRKQVFRRHDAHGGFVGDVITGRTERVEDATPLLHPCVVNGQAAPDAMAAADAARERVARDLERLPAALRRLAPLEGEGDYPVTLSERLAGRAGEAP